MAGIYDSLGKNAYSKSSTHLRLGNPLKDEDIVQAEKITRFLRDGRDAEDITTSLCAYAVAWVSQNPEVLTPLEADYSR